jgi:hypothetical protein
MDSTVDDLTTDVIESCESKELGLPGLVAGCMTNWRLASASMSILLKTLNSARSQSEKPPERCFSTD